VDKRWLMIGAGLILLAVGLVTGRLPVLILGVLLLVLGVLAEGAQSLDLDLLRGRLVLKRETVEETMLRRAADKGISEKEAHRVAGLIAARVPEEGAQVSISDELATAALEKGSVAFPLPEGGKVDEELLAERFVDQSSKALLRDARLRDVIREAGYEKSTMEDTLLHPGPGASETIELAEATAAELLDAAGKVDITKTLLIYPSGRYAVQTLELTTEGEMTIGREQSCDIVLDDPAVSAVHALLRVSVRGEVKIVDNDSTNGVFVNKEKVGVRTLRNRDLVDIGDRTFLFVEPGKPAETDEELSTA
jgi:hypothetical protein